jgi:hypothetical protein
VFSAFCRDHILHDILPECRIKFSTMRTDVTLERHREELLPVIKRIQKEKRVLPENRVVFEPSHNGSGNCGLFRPGEFAPAGIDFFLPNSLTAACHWDLSGSRRPRERDFRREGPVVPEDPHSLRRRYYKFRDLDSKDFPEQFRVNVFYKRPAGSQGANLFAVSIPLDCLVQRLLKDVPESSRPGFLGRSARTRSS